MMNNETSFIGDVIDFDHGSKTAICRETLSAGIHWSAQWKTADGGTVYVGADSYAHARAIFYEHLFKFWEDITKEGQA